MKSALFYKVAMPKKGETSHMIDLTKNEHPEMKDLPITTKTVTIYTNITKIHMTEFEEKISVRMPEITNKTDLKRNYGAIGDVIGTTFADKHEGIRKLIKAKPTKKPKGKFPWQFTVWITVEETKNVTAMIFQNGTFNITGAKYQSHVEFMVRRLFSLIIAMQRKYGNIADIPEDEILYGIAYTHMVNINMKILQKLGTKEWLIEYFSRVATLPNGDHITVEYNEENNSSVTIIFPFTAPKNPKRFLMTSKPYVTEKGKHKISFESKLVKTAPFTYKMQKSAFTDLDQKFIVHTHSVIQAGRFYDDVMPYWYEKFLGMLQSYLKWVDEVKIKKIKKISVNELFDD